MEHIWYGDATPRHDDFDTDVNGEANARRRPSGRRRARPIKAATPGTLRGDGCRHPQGRRLPGLAHVTHGNRASESCARVGNLLDATAPPLSLGPPSPGTQWSL